MSIAKLSKEDVKSIIEMAHSKNDFSIVKEKLQKHLEDYFKEYKFSDPKVVSDRLYRMIGYAISRYDHYSNLRHKYLTLGLSIIGIGATLIGLSSKFFGEINIVSQVFALLSFVVLVITGLKIIYTYNTKG